MGTIINRFNDNDFQFIRDASIEEVLKYSVGVSYISTNANEVLSILLPKYKISNFNGIVIPDVGSDRIKGSLAVLQYDNVPGIESTIETLEEKNEIFKGFRRHLTDKQKTKIYDQIMSEFESEGMFRREFNNNYKAIFKALGKEPDYKSIQEAQLSFSINYAASQIDKQAERNFAHESMVKTMDERELGPDLYVEDK